MGKHNAKTLKREGYFEKGASGQDYRSNCSSGFKGARWDAHHILPAYSFACSIEGTADRSSSSFNVSALDKEKQEFIRNCLWVTPWDIDDAKNLIGMPQLNTFMMAYEESAADKLTRNVFDNEYMKARFKSFNNKKLSDRQSWFALTPTNDPTGYCVHRPVSWGHTEYNRAVAVELNRIWKKLNKKKDEHSKDPKDHGIAPSAIASDIDSVLSSTKGDLQSRGANATKDNWHKQYSKKVKVGNRATRIPADTNWYKNFIMQDGWNPVEGNAAEDSEED